MVLFLLLKLHLEHWQCNISPGSFLSQLAC